MDSSIEKSLENAYHATICYKNYNYKKKESGKYVLLGLSCATYLGLRALFGEVDFNSEPDNLFQLLDLVSSVGGFASLFYGGLEHLRNNLGSKHYKNELEKERKNLSRLTGSTIVFPEEQPKSLNSN